MQALRRSCESLRYAKRTAFVPPHTYLPHAQARPVLSWDMA